jgi:hypothetical protein
MRSAVWWGTWPLVLGLGGILLLAVGARAMRAPDEEINAKKMKWENEQQKRAMEKMLRRSFQQRGQPDDEVGESAEPPPEELQDQRDQAAVIAGRLAFFCGLVLTAAAGVVLFRYAPDRDKPDWGVG